MLCMSQTGKSMTACESVADSLHASFAFGMHSQKTMTQAADDVQTDVHFRKEAADDAATEPLLSSFLYASILSHDNFKQVSSTLCPKAGKAAVSVCDSRETIDDYSV